ncbi:MAG: S8 family serine peptidase [Anaerocolumna sp.]
MRKKLTAALTALVFVITSIAANPVTYAKTAATQEEVKSFTKAESSNEVKKSTIKKNITGKTYAPDDEVTLIVELKDIPLLEHFKKDQSDGFANRNQISSFDEYAETFEAEQITNSLLKQQKTITDKIQILTSEKSTAEVIYNYTAVMNGFAIRVKYKSLADIKKLPTVKAAYIAGSYEKIEPVMDTSTHTVGAVAAWDLNLKGEGTIVAILDTGLDTGHIGFQKNPASPKFTEHDIQQKIENSPGLKSGITNAATTYVSEKIPYAFDYADNDSEVTPSPESVVQNGNEHGTHVAGTIAAPEDDGDNVTGVAPEAQLMIMKVFSDTIGVPGAYTEDILAALDDTVTLGADVINMSLGSPSGFTYDGEASVSEVYNRITKAGITLAVSAGNSYSSSYHNGLDGYSLSGNPDTSVVGSPSTYAASTSVASVVNANYHASYFEVNGEPVTYMETAAGSQPVFCDLTVVSGGAVEYVPIPNVGNPQDYNGVDVTGKVALVKRGSIAFNDKLLNAVSGGAIGIVVYNNQPGTISMAITDYLIPAVSITTDDGEKLLASENKVLTVTGEEGTFPDENANHLSDFSSWGVTPDLKLKPEIAAPGENIYSTLPFDKYGSMSGTSMAAPHIAGTFALVKQYLNSCSKFSSEYDKSELANELLMSTAIPAKNEEGTYYSPRKQGSGIVNVYNAVNTDAYLYAVDETEENQRPKLNLGDDASRTGVFEKSFHIRSVTGSAITFIPQVTTLTETDAGGTIDETSYDISGDTNVQITINGENTDIITLQPLEDAEVTVSVQLSDSTKDYLNTSFENGEFIDGFVILDSIETNYDLTIPFMGFYGDWTQAPLFDSGSANDLQGYQQNVHALLTDNGYSYLGVNPFDQDAYDLIGNYNPYLYPEYYDYYTPRADLDKIAISPNSDDSFDRLDIAQLSLLRNARSLNWSITDENNNVIDSDSYLYRPKSIYVQDYSTVVPTFLDTINWDGTDAEGNLLENDSVVTFKVDGELDYDGHGQNNANSTLSFPITVDLENPTLEAVSENENLIQITVKDNQYVSAVFLVDKTDLGTPLALCLLDEDAKDMPSQINVDLNNLGLADKTASDLAVVIYDYAANYNIYLLDRVVTPTPTVPGTSPTPTQPEASPTPTVPVITPTPTDPTPSVPVATPTAKPTHRPKPTSKPPKTPTISVTPTVTQAPEITPVINLVTVTPSTKTLFVGETSKITVTLPSLNEKEVPSISYRSNNKAAATVSNAGMITAKKAGYATITTKVTLKEFSKDFVTKVTVKNPYVSFGKKPATVYVGNSYSFTAKAYGIKDKITYSISDVKIASINRKTGKLTALKAGSVYITAKAGKVTKRYKVTVKNPYIQFTRKQSTLKVGNSFDFNVKAYGVTGKITYRVSDTKLAAIVKKTGVLTTKKKGTVSVIAKIGTITKKYKVTILK